MHEAIREAKVIRRGAIHYIRWIHWISLIAMRILIAVCIAICVATFCLYVNPYTRWLLGVPSGYDVVETIRLGNDPQDARIEYVAERSIQQPSDVRLRVQAPGRSFFLQSLSQLGGLVHIRSTEEALQLVRLSTTMSYQLGFPWPHEAEIGPYTGRGSQQTYDPWGLPQDVFRREGFTKPKIHTGPVGYIVERWILRCDAVSNSTLLLHVEEHVSPDGSNRRRILLERQPPRYPNISWGTYGRE